MTCLLYYLLKLVFKLFNEEGYFVFCVERIWGIWKIIGKHSKNIEVKEKKVTNAVETLAKSWYRYTRSEFENSLASLGMPMKTLKTGKNNPKWISRPFINTNTERKLCFPICCKPNNPISPNIAVVFECHC